MDWHDGAGWLGVGAATGFWVSDKIKGRREKNKDNPNKFLRDERK